MIEVATCSYGEFRPEMGYPIRTSRGAPKWFTHPYMSWENVFPTYAMLQLPFEQYQPRYLQMRESDNAKFRDIAVIATWLLEQPWTFCDGDGIEEFDAIEAVKSLIQAQTDAGLGTFVLDGLKAYIESMQQVKSMPTLAPKLGRVWKYGSGPWAAS